jgi:hemoglobin
MRCLMQWKVPLSACLLLAAVGAARADDKARSAKPLERRVLDEAIYENLRDIINQGAPMYNQGDWNGCYRLWEGSLLSVRPLLDHRPTLQPIIDGAIANARQDPLLWRRAFVLRPALDKIRADIDADYPHGKKAKDEDKTSVAAPEKKKTMWERLGGKSGVTRLVDDYVNVVSKDPKVDFFRHNKYKVDAEQIDKMKREFVEQISEATGGPLKYTGPDMKKVHKGMGITDAQFDAATADLKTVLEKHQVGAEDRKTILDAVARYRKEVVEPKKPEEKKPEEKKPILKKPTEKNPEEKKADTPAEITGKVLYKGKPAAGAQVSFVPAEGKPVSGKVAADGTYQLTVKPGVYAITVSGPANLGLPAKYADPKKPQMKVGINEGKQNRDINLE